MEQGRTFQQNLPRPFEQQHKHAKGVTLAAWPVLQTSAYLSASISSTPPFHQEIAAMGEARGRHSRTASPPRWTTVDFFTGRRVKSGGEAEEQSGATAVHQGKMCITSNCGNCVSPLNGLIVRKNYGNEMQSQAPPKSHFSQVLFIHGGSAFVLLIAHCVHLLFHWLCVMRAASSAYLQPWAQHWHRWTRVHSVLHTDTSQNPTGWSWIWSVFQLQCGLDPVDPDSKD